EHDRGPRLPAGAAGAQAGGRPRCGRLQDVLKLRRLHGLRVRDRVVDPTSVAPGRHRPTRRTEFEVCEGDMDNVLPELGGGLGYRVPLHEDIVGNAHRIDFLEVISDQYLHAPDERVERMLELRARFPLIPHGVGMSVGTAAPIDAGYLDRLAGFVARTGAA